MSFFLIKVIKLRVLSLTGYVLQDFFCPKQVQSLKPSADHLYPNIDLVPPTPLQGTFFFGRTANRLDLLQVDLLDWRLKPLVPRVDPRLQTDFVAVIFSLDILKDNTIHSSFQGCKALNLACERGTICHWKVNERGQTSGRSLSV